jgi:dinuclear metal center YbgI/SA1388 family protein
MIKLEDFVHQLDAYLEPALFSDYCPNGLQVEGHREIKKVGTAVSASLDTLEAAADLGLDALVVHHGMFWKGDDYCVLGSKRRKLEILFEAGMSLLAYHLPLDAHKEVGNNWVAARELGLIDLEGFGKMGAFEIGVKGRLPEPCEIGLFRTELQNYYQHPVHAAPGGAERVERVAIVSGGAHKLVSDAAKEGMDLFITGSFDEPVWHQAAEEKIHFAAVGHSNSERVGPRALAQWLEEEMELDCVFIDRPNPF